MPARVTLRVNKPLMGQSEFVFEERTTCVIGRDQDCHPRVPDDKAHRVVSRHHCLLDINPPDVRVRDFGSLNGTYVNGRRIGQREKGQTPEEAAQIEVLEYDLKDGDRIKLGNTVFRVEIYVPAICADCSAEIPDDRRRQARVAPDVYRCRTCRRQGEAARREKPPKRKPVKCVRCGRDVAGEAGSRRRGEYVCSSCRADPLEIVLRLLKLAKSGRKDLAAIKGYTVDREIAQGGMGAIFLAHDDRTGEQVALKIMLPQVAADQRAQETFLREIENGKALKHPNVVELRDAGCSQGAFFFTLEFCGGGSVDKLMAARGGRLPIGESAPIILQTLDGLEYAHHAPIPNVRLRDGNYGRGTGVVHRDVSPQNILLTGAGSSRVAKVSDFGLAKAFDMAGLSGQTRTGTAAGKPLFMPRQQVINFKHAKPEVDVWATAACLYHMLTGRYPRDFNPNKDVWHTVLRTDAVPIRQRDPSIPKRLAKVIDAALRDKPKIGFQTAAELKRQLEGVL